MEASQKWSSPRYRRVGVGSNIDESLFGSNTEDKETMSVSSKSSRSRRSSDNSRLLPPTGKNGATGNAHLAATLAGTTAVILSSRELEEIKV